MPPRCLNGLLQPWLKSPLPQTPKCPVAPQLREEKQLLWEMDHGSCFFYTESKGGGELPLLCRRAIQTLLPKKGKPHDLRNCRPVPVLCTDNKVIMKAISLHLRPVQADVIHSDQTHMVPGCSTFNDLYLVWDMLKLSQG